MNDGYCRWGQDLSLEHRYGLFWCVTVNAACTFADQFIFETLTKIKDNICFCFVEFQGMVIKMLSADLPGLVAPKCIYCNIHVASPIFLHSARRCHWKSCRRIVGRWRCGTGPRRGWKLEKSTGTLEALPPQKKYVFFLEAGAFYCSFVRKYG